MKFLIYIVGFLCINIGITISGSCATVETITDGYWNDGTIWSTGMTPQSGDSVFIHHQVLATGDSLILHDYYLVVTDSGCFCGEKTIIIFDNSEHYNYGHMAFVAMELTNFAYGENYGLTLLASFVKVSGNGSYKIKDGRVKIYSLNDLSCNCTEEISTDTTDSPVDSTSTTRILLDFEHEFGLNSDTFKICEGSGISINRSQSLKYQWSTGDTTPYIHPRQDGWYSLSLSNDNEIVKDSMFIKIRQPVSVVLPNIITPNKDGLNDQIRINSEEVRIEKFWVFNRWGKLVYQYNINEHGQWLIFPTDQDELSDGIFYYNHIFGDHCSRELREQKGWFHISK